MLPKTLFAFLAVAASTTQAIPLPNGEDNVPINVINNPASRSRAKASDLADQEKTRDVGVRCASILCNDSRFRKVVADKLGAPLESADLYSYPNYQGSGGKSYFNGHGPSWTLVTYGPGHVKHPWPGSSYRERKAKGKITGLRFRNVGTDAEPKPRIGAAQARRLHLPHGFPNEGPPAELGQNSGSGSDSGKSKSRSPPLHPKYRSLSASISIFAPVSSPSVLAQSREHPTDAKRLRDVPDLLSYLTPYPKRARTPVTVDAGPYNHFSDPPSSASMPVSHETSPHLPVSPAHSHLSVSPEVSGGGGGSPLTNPIRSSGESGSDYEP